MAETASPVSHEHHGEGSTLRGWPASVLVLLVLAAAIYAFSPRPHPQFTPTQVRSDGLQINGLTGLGSRRIAVGELGHILVAEASGGSWRLAKVEPNRGSPLTQVALIGENLALAVGHDGWILRSEDGGETWKEVAFSTERAEPLLGIAGPFDGKLFTFGGFGLFMTSTDLGQTWQQGSLVEQGAGSTAEVAAQPAPDADPFAAAAKSGIADRHLNAMVKAGDGSLLLVGERGLLVRSTDNGQTWQRLPEIYPGSFFGALVLPPHGLLVFGMRGNAFVSHNLGQTWQKCEIPGAVSLFGGTVTPSGDVVLVGDGNIVLVSKDGGAHFERVSRGERRSLAAVLRLENGDLQTAGEGGLRRLTFDRKSSATGEQP